MLFVILTKVAFLQELAPVNWHFSYNNEQNLIIAEAKIDSGWYLYSQIQNEDGPIPTAFYLENNNGEFEQMFANRNSDYVKNDYDEMFETTLTKFYTEVTFSIKPLNENYKNGYVEFMCCDNTKCLPPKKIYFNLNKN
ncbi:MAG: hypothetical protein R2836_08380 [Chitinophagales bacterium]|nr:hypothetical protein [Chitinophagales bacterium]